jgi:hypothetical protein
VAACRVSVYFVSSACKKRACLLDSISGKPRVFGSSGVSTLHPVFLQCMCIERVSDAVIDSPSPKREFRGSSPTRDKEFQLLGAGDFHVLDNKAMFSGTAINPTYL